MKAKYIFFTLLLYTQLGWAQRYEFSDSLTYGDQVREWFSRASDSSTIKLGEQFAVFWDGGTLSSTQKDTLTAITTQMLAKNYKLKPYLADLHATVLYAVDSANISAANLDAMLGMLHKMTLYYERRQVGYGLNTLKSFFADGAIYRVNYNKLYAEADGYSFEFIPTSQDELIPEEELSEGEDEFLSEEDPWVTDEEEVAEEDAWGDDAWGDDDAWADEDWGTAADETLPETEEEEEGDIIDYLIQEPIQPELVGAVMRFQNVDFTFATTFDTAHLRQANGALMLKDQLFVGEGGKFDWAIAGLSEDSVYCTLGKYNFDIRVPKLNAEKATMTYLGKIKEPVEGLFEFASERHLGPRDARYPRFKSYRSDVTVNIYDKQEINPNQVSLIGGFSLMGNRISSASFYEGETMVEVREKGARKFKATSLRFGITDSLMTSSQAGVVIYQNNDSIYHPAVKFKYILDSSYLVLQTTKGNFKRTPFISTFLKMDIRADMIQWNLQTDSLAISTLSARDKVPVLFESQEYFSEEQFDQLGRMYDFHPLILAVSYARKNRSGTFYADDMAQSVRKNPKIIRSAMKDLMGQGFIEYDEESGEVTLKRKAYHYVLSKAKQKDFDDLVIPSFASDGPNAVLNLDSMALAVQGIEKFTISNELNVQIIPNNNEVTMLGQRDFQFDGTLLSGNFEFTGQNFTFKYDSFRIDLPQIDSIAFYLLDEKGNRKKVDNTLQSGIAAGMQNTSGTLYINDPQDRSARSKDPSFPKFDAENGAIVYFDNNGVLDGAYDKSVYYVIPPFDIDSLNSADPSAISFPGTLYSDMLPPVEENLSVLSDNSMGFEHQTPTGGYALYGGTATYNDKLTLNANGLRGTGTIDYLSTTLESEDFIFYMDSVITTGTVLDMQAGSVGTASFPQAYVEDYEMTWLPRQDSMYITNRANPFDLYDQTASMNGQVILTGDGLLGAGTLFTRGSEAISENMAFEQSQFSARNANFEIKSDNPKKPALAGEDVYLNFDLVANQANISPEVEGVAAIGFPYAQFRTSIIQAVWDLEEETVRMSKPENVAIENSYFYATRAELDSLVFNAEEAIYRIPLQQLDISGIPYITVADAKITPENNQVQIRENAKFDTFTNATLVIDTLNEYHNLFNGTIDIISRNEFRGKATYELVSASDTFAIQLTEFFTDSVQADRRGKKWIKHTVADGTVQEAQNLIISPGMLYRGNIRMHAAKEALELDGEVKLDFKTIPNYNTWISYLSEAGDKELKFDIASSTTDTGEPLTAGLHLDRSNSLYMTFVTDLRSPEDPDIFRPQGMLSFNEEEQKYTIRSPKKDEPNALSGDVFTFDENDQSVAFEGKLNLLPYPEAGLTIQTAGSGKGDLQTNEYKLDAFMTIDIDLPAQTVAMMGEDLNAALNKSGARAAISDRTRLLYKLAEFIGDRAAREFDELSISEYTPMFSMGPQLEKTIVLADVQLVWSDEHKAWYSTSPLGISNVQETDINGQATGFLEIKPTDEGTIINLFVQASADSWYYFSHQNNRMGIWAYNEEFCDEIGARSKMGKADSDEFAFYLSDISETLTFINRFRQTYLGIDEPYNFDIVPDMIADEEAEEEDKEADRDGF
ncbi:hypothetical protein [Tunicatimonas pelagia]|uniref:hypothetical protein n=1 Tax=Tunicatimonas pelagia TaxID=931531 RepID=UPI002666689A|nr:hypothetical protein [Tunicatimonas pelagia]WKN46045.1 hypothetical protein P0M28_13905 [Tunicatimonas pelagia]